MHRSRFNAVVVWKFDRFAQSVSHLLRALETFQGIEFVSFSEQLDTKHSSRQDGLYGPGKRIAFESDRLGYWEIWVCNTIGENCEQLTSLHGTAGTTSPSSSIPQGTATFMLSKYPKVEFLNLYPRSQGIGRHWVRIIATGPSLANHDCCGTEDDWNRSSVSRI